MNRNASIVSLWAALVLASPAAAQEVTRLPEGAEQSVGLELGLQSALVTRGSYSRSVGPGLLYGRFTLPSANLDFGDFAVEAGGQISALESESGSWKLQVSFAPVLRRTDNDLFSAHGLGFHAALMPGYHGRRWGLMAELGYEKMLATHVSHTSLYRSVAYSGAKDGWYSSTAGTLQAGLRAGYRLGRVELSLAAGVLATEKLNAVVPPFYGTLGSSYAF